MAGRIKTSVLKDAILKLLRRGYTRNLKKLIEKIHPVDLALVFSEVEFKYRKIIFELISDDEYIAELISQINDRELVAELLQGMDYGKVCNIFHHMEYDDAADILGHLPPEASQAILMLMKKEDADEVTKLLKYDPYTAGGIMDPNYFALRADITAEEGIKQLRGAKDIDMVFYIYVVNNEEKLLGVLSLRQLVLAAPDTRVSTLMDTDVFFVNVETDQEEVARVVGKYDLLAVPVVEKDKTLVGMITVDDVIDVIREEATEDFLMMSGTSTVIDLNTVSIFNYAKARFPWLLACFAGGILSSRVINYFEHSLTNIIALAAFIPIVLGMSGNVGSQSASIIVRNLALGRIDVKNLTRIVFKEIRVGLTLGVLYGTLLGSVAFFLYRGIPRFHFVVGASIFVAMSVAATVGSLVPLSFERLKIDPSLASGPFVTTIMDIIGISIYFLTATSLLTFHIL
ncbi:MAG: magnesium transporter [Oligoflexia bacterium]|nr:magnesium transporter [Oligoflexia bacterium]